MSWAAVIGAGASLAGGLIGGKKKKQTTTQELPPHITAGQTDAINRGQGIMDQPYTPYTGDRFAGLNPMQTNAYATSDMFGQMGLGALGGGYNALNDMTGQNMMGNAYGMQGNVWNGMMGLAGMGQQDTPLSRAMYSDTASAGQAAQGQASLADRGAIQDVEGGSFLDLNRGDYMNPYTQNVSNNVLSDFNRLGQQQMQQQGAAANAAGAFGGSRHGVADAMLLGENNRNYGQLSDQLWNQAYDNASGLMGQDLNRGFQAGLANQGMDWNTQNLNANLGSQMSMFNTGQTNQQNQFNAGQSNQVGMYNAGLGTANNQFNAANRLQNQQFGQGLTLEALMGAGQVGQSMGNIGQGIGNMSLDQGNSLTSYGIQGLGSQLGAGGLLQQYEQGFNDFDYNQFLENRGWANNQYGVGLGGLQASNAGGAGTMTQDMYGPSYLSQAVGGAATGMGLYDLFKNRQPAGWGPQPNRIPTGP